MYPCDVASVVPRGLIGRIYVGDHYSLLLTKYISCEPHGFREDYLKVFPIISLLELLIPGCGQFGPQGLDWQDLCRGPLDITTC